MDNGEFGKTASGLHDQVLKLLSDGKKGTLLDAPSGEGEMSYLLSQEGFNVTAGDIDDSVFKPKDIRFQKINMDQALPFDDGSFDNVISIEGVEHLENPFHLFREFSRILKPGGTLILSTPNILNIFSRLRFFLIGYPEHFGDYYSQEDNFYVLHINAISFPELKVAYERGGFQLEKAESNRSNIWTRGIFTGILLSFLLIFVRAFSRLKIRDKNMREKLLQPEILLGEILILKLKKG